MLFPENVLISGKISYIRKIFLYIRKMFFIFRKKCDISGNFFWYVRKFFLRGAPPPPDDALFFSKSAPQSLAPPTFRSFLRPCFCKRPEARGQDGVGRIYNGRATKAVNEIITNRDMENAEATIQ